MKLRFFLIVPLCAALQVTLPGIAAAAEPGNRWGAWLEVGRFFNLVLVVVILVLVVRKPLVSFFSGRTRAIHEQLAEAQRAKREAEAKLAEMQLRMSRLDDELREIKDAAEKEARFEYERLIEAAERERDKILERSKQEIEEAVRAAKKALKIHTAELSVKLAEDIIMSEMTEADSERLLSSFIAKLGDGK